MSRFATNLLVVCGLLCFATDLLAVTDSGIKIQRAYELCEKEGGDCYRRLEQNSMSESTDKVKRYGDTLTIATEAKPLVFQISKTDKAITSYTYLGFYREIGYHLVNRVSHGEDIDYLFVSDKSGQIFVVPSIPHVSPSSTYVIAMADGDTYPYEIVIWKATPNNLVQQFRYIQDKYMQFALKNWSVDSEIQIEASTYINGEPCSIRKLLRLDTNQNKWNLANAPNAAISRCKQVNRAGVPFTR